MKLHLHLFLDAREVMLPYVPLMEQWVQKWSAVPQTEVHVYTVSQLKWREIKIEDYKGSLTSADTASVAYAAHQWALKANPRGERHVIHCVSGNPLRVGGNTTPTAMSADFRRLCPPGTIYLTGSGIGCMLSAYLQERGWDAQRVLNIGNDTRKIALAGEIWADRWAALQTTLNPEMGAMLLSLRAPAAASVLPSVIDYFTPGNEGPEVAILWERLDTLIRTHDWTYDKADDHRKYDAGARSARDLSVLTQQLTGIDAARVREIYESHNQKPVYA